MPDSLPWRLALVPLAASARAGAEEDGWAFHALPRPIGSALRLEGVPLTRLRVR